MSRRSASWPNEDAQSFDVRRQQSVQASTNSPAGTASKAAAAPITACSTPRNSTSGGFVQCLVRPVLQPVRDQFIRTGRHRQYRPRQRPRYTGESDYVARAVIPAQQALTHSPRASVSTATLSRCSGPNWRRMPTSTVGTSVCCMAIMPRSPMLGFLDRRQGMLGTASVKLDANWVLLGAARYDINARTNSIRPASALAISTIASSWP